MSDILNKILDVKADEVNAAKKHQDYASLRREVESDAEARAAIRGFAASLRSTLSVGKVGVIAEINSKGTASIALDGLASEYTFEAGEFERVEGGAA
jgi:indole-3-glycerol phosphate synthase